MFYEDFLDLVDKTFHQNPELRYGQTVMNVLYSVWPSKHSELVANHVDCFYDNSNVDFVLTHLKTTWNEKFS